MNNLFNAPGIAWFSSFFKVLCVESLPGDASTRKYYRIRAPDRTYILMKMAPFEDACALPFLAVQKYLQDIGVRVPRVFEVCEGDGLLLLEDLGFDRVTSRGMDNSTQIVVKSKTKVTAANDSRFALAA